MTAPTESGFDPRTITRPDPVLWSYYLITAVLTLLGFPFVVVPLYFKYKTLKYRFDDGGIAMSYGVFFRKEVYLTYRRIQDIHVSRNIIQRWMGLANVAVQTASGNSTPEMTIEGVLQADELRDFLYQKMRGAKGLDAAAAPGEAHVEHAAPADASAEALVLLREIRDALASRQPGSLGAAARSQYP